MRSALRAPSWLLLLSCYAGCNDLVGIDPPLDPPNVSLGGGAGADGGGDASAGESGSGGSGAGAAGDSSSDAGDGGQPFAGGSSGIAIVSVPHAFAEWPMPNAPASGLPNPQTYDTVSLAGVVVDRVTGIEWQRVVETRLHDASDAVSYCEDLALAEGGWRLPTRIELLSLVDVTMAAPSIDTAVFPGTPIDHHFWTTSPVAGDPLSAWSVNFNFGDGLGYVSPRDAKLYVRCARLGHSPPEGSRYTSEDGFVTDASTELDWEEPVQASTYALAQAGEYCAALDTDGGGWRLPSVNELQTLIDETRVGPAIDTGAFRRSPVDFFWTSSTVVGFTNYGWSVSFANGTANFFAVSQQHVVRCVR